MRAQPTASADARTLWRQWADRELAGTSTELEAATDAALEKLRRGGTQSQAAEAARLVVYPRSRNLVRGRVAGLIVRSEAPYGANTIVWNFRIERTNQNGRRLDPIAVEMRGPSFRGVVANGDVVETTTPQRAGAVLKLNKIRNLTSNSIVEKANLAGRKVIFGAQLIPLIVILSVFIIFFLRLGHH